MTNKFDRLTTRVFRDLNESFTNAGYKIRICGGAVRDILRGVEPTDIDFATNATPEQVKELMKTQPWDVIETGIEHGTVTLHDNTFGDYEVTTLRNDVDSDGRHAEVEFTDSWEEDAARRDFTINAMYMDFDGNVYDYFDGQKHLKINKIKFVGDAVARVHEDALRMIRYYRIGLKFQNPIFDCKDTRDIMNNIQLLKHCVSVERIWSEFRKICKDNPENVGRFLDLLTLTGIAELLEIPTKPPFMIDLLDNHYVQAFPECAIATQFESLDDVHNFVEKYKLSTNEYTNMVFFVKHAILKDFHSFGFSDAEDLINNGVPRELIKLVACYHRNGFLEEGIDSIEYTKFPVSGKDLIAAGHKPGPDMGKTLDKLRKVWEDSRYKLSKDELLEMLL